MLKASVDFQFATWKSSSFTFGLALSAFSSPDLRSIAGVFDRMPPSATMPPDPPIALINAFAVSSPY
jgi:hypothetical protein